MTLSTVLRHWMVGGLPACGPVACSAAPPGPGDVPPPMLGYTRGGGPVHVTDFPGKALVVTFWAHMGIIGRDGHVVKVWHGDSEDSLPAICDDQNRALAAPG